MNMSLKLSDIGALLGVDEGLYKNYKFSTWRSCSKIRKNKTEDRISKIRQNDSDEFTDVVGWKLMKLLI